MGKTPGAGVPVFDGRKFPTSKDVGGGRGHQPPGIKGKGPQTFAGGKFGAGKTTTNDPNPAFNPKPVKGQGAQTYNGPIRFGKIAAAPDRSYNPKSPKSGSNG